MDRGDSAYMLRRSATAAKRSQGADVLDFLQSDLQRPSRVGWTHLEEAFQNNEIPADRQEDRRIRRSAPRIRRPRRIQKPLNGLNERARSSNRICRFLDLAEAVCLQIQFEDSLESQAVILLARADGAGDSRCDHASDGDQ